MICFWLWNLPGVKSDLHTIIMVLVYSEYDYILPLPVSIVFSLFFWLLINIFYFDISSKADLMLMNSLNFVCLRKSLSHLHFWRTALFGIILLGITFLVGSFSFSFNIWVNSSAISWFASFLIRNLLIVLQNPLNIMSFFSV